MKFDHRFMGVVLIVTGVLLGGFFLLDSFTGSKNRRRFGDRWGSDLDGQNPYRALDEDDEAARARSLQPERLPTFDDPRLFLTPEEWKRVQRSEHYEYVVREGDSIERLAQKYLGTVRQVEWLYWANPHLESSRHISPGDRIIIPLQYRR